MWLTQLLLESWIILKESAAFILVGFLIAGGLHVVLANARWIEWLKGLGARSVLLASAVGLPLPLCSCSVLPAAVSLRKQGASKGATLSFLISTPETSVQSILLTYSLLGPVMAVFRPIAACLTAMVAGLVENFVERRARSAPASPPDGDVATCACPEGDQPADERIRWADGLRHAFVDIFDDIVAWILIGILVAAIIQVAIPDFVIDAVFGPPLQAMLIMLIIGIPLYVCAESSTPIAAVLIAQGVSPGAALVFLLAGPATNIGAVGVLARQLGRRTVTVYLVSIAVVSVFMGLALDGFFGSRGISLTERALEEPFVPGWLKALGAIIFLLLCLASMRRLKYLERSAAALNWLLPVRVTSARVVGTAAAALILGYAGSGLFILQPGQVGMVKRFGRVVRRDVPPGLHYTWPFPIGAVDRIDTRWVYRLDLDYTPTDEDDDTSPTDRTKRWVMLGDENIARIKCTTHWCMKEGQTARFAYGAAERERLVENAVRAALRFVLGSANIETVLTTEQGPLRQRVQSEAQAMLTRCECGIEIMSFDFIDLHAPPEVHDAFRDIASALEDRDRLRNEALTVKARVVPRARGSKQEMILGAHGYATRIQAEAAGEADAFLQTLAAYVQYPALTRARLVYEMYDRVLPGLRKCVKPSSENLYLDLRFGGKEQEQKAPF